MAADHAACQDIRRRCRVVGDRLHELRQSIDALNDESTLMVRDRGIGSQMIRLFFDDLQHATEITASEFRRRLWRYRLAERTANLLTRIL